MGMFKTLKYMLRFQKCQRETQKLCEATPTKFFLQVLG